MARTIRPQAMRCRGQDAGIADARQHCNHVGHLLHPLPLLSHFSALLHVVPCFILMNASATPPDSPFSPDAEAVPATPSTWRSWAERNAARLWLGVALAIAVTGIGIGGGLIYTFLNEASY